jgi:hypothetical protein
MAATGPKPMTAWHANARSEPPPGHGHQTASVMNDSPSPGPQAPAVDTSIFTIVGGTTIPDRAAIVRADCREGSRVELRMCGASGSHIDVWLQCRSRLRLVKAWKKIGHVPEEAAVSLLPLADANSTVIAQGTVKTVYAPPGRDEAVVTVEIRPQLRD